VASATGAAGLIDTDILIDAARGVTSAVLFINNQRAASGINISIISAMELIAGCRNRAELIRVQQSLQRMHVLPLSASASHTAFTLMESFFLSHSLVIPDALIAATALERAMTLYTKNVRHFQMIPGLTVARPY
jgi:predicted nucleic acid-binding protein